MLTPVEILGWFSTVMILLGALVNARGRSLYAMVIWILGDLCWLVYDVFIFNYSHLTLCLVIIIINVYGIYRLWKLSSDKKNSNSELKN